MHLAEVGDVIAATSKSAFEEDDADSVCLVCTAVGPSAPELTSARSIVQDRLVAGALFIAWRLAKLDRARTAHA